MPSVDLNGICRGIEVCGIEPTAPSGTRKATVAPQLAHVAPPTSGLANETSPSGGAAHGGIQPRFFFAESVTSNRSSPDQSASARHNPSRSGCPGAKLLLDFRDLPAASLDSYCDSRSLSLQRIECLAVRLEGGGRAGEFLPALDDDIGVLRTAAKTTSQIW